LISRALAHPARGGEAGHPSAPAIDALQTDARASMIKAGARDRSALPWSVGGLPPLAPLGGGPAPDDPALRVLPVRLPAADYERLRTFSREHGFSMAVIIRTLVERFLDGQARRWASRRGGPGDDLDDDLDGQTTAGHA
ncbi:MAG TPA: hypothetical protein VI248_25735, partial [Kineosporiaceae bacterium]